MITLQVHDEKRIMLTLTIDGKEIGAHEGMTVLEAARSVGIEIPTLCHHEALSSYGACRLCSVEVTQRGRSKLVVSCLFPVAQGLEVQTNSARVKNLRSGILELLLARCPGSEELQDLATSLGIKQGGFGFAQDSGKCILCGLCVRACQEIAEKSVLSFAGRGIDRRVATPFYKPSDDCITCRACAFICPTRAIRFEGGKLMLPD